MAEASKASVAVTPLMQASDEGGKIGQVSGRDCGCMRQMLQAVGLDGPRWAVPQDRTDAGLLRTREHGAGYRSRTSRAGTAGRPHTRPGDGGDYDLLVGIRDLQFTLYPLPEVGLHLRTAPAWLAATSEVNRGRFAGIENGWRRLRRGGGWGFRGPPRPSPPAP